MRKKIIAAGSVAAATATTAVVLILGAGALPATTTAQLPAVDAAVPAAQSVGVAAASPDQTAAFPALGGGLSSAQAVAAQSDIQQDPRLLRSLGTPQRQWGVNPALAKTIFGTGPTHLLMVPGGTEVCLVSTGTAPAAACGRASTVETRGILLWRQSFDATSASTASVYGALPNGAHTVRLTNQDGTTIAIALNGDGAFEADLQSAPSHLDWMSADGAEQQSGLR